MTDFNKLKSPIEDIIEDARNGRMFILVDDEDRENEGDLVIPGQMATPEAINFMAMYGRGLICLAMDRDRIEQLGLPLMARRNEGRFHTAFTVSIEAKEGVTTGISAPDRARTIAVAIDASKDGSDIVTPGHVFPLISQDGGVLARTGHTEASVDISRLAGLNPSGVICEIMNDDGTMARRDDLITVAQQHDLKIGTIADLIAYRLQHDNLVSVVATRPFKSNFGGDFVMKVYRSESDGSEHIALIKGEATDTAMPVRVHALSVLDDVLGDTESGTAGLLQAALRKVDELGRGVIVVIREALVMAPTTGDLRDVGEQENDPEETAIRNYGVGAQILLDLGVRDMVLLRHSNRPVPGLEGYGLRITGTEKLEMGDS